MIYEIKIYYGSMQLSHYFLETQSESELQMSIMNKVLSTPGFVHTYDLAFSSLTCNTTLEEAKLRTYLLKMILDSKLIEMVVHLFSIKVEKGKKPEKYLTDSNPLIREYARDLVK